MNVQTGEGSSYSANTFAIFNSTEGVDWYSLPFTYQSAHISADHESLHRLINQPSTPQTGDTLDFPQGKDESNEYNNISNSSNINSLPEKGKTSIKSLAIKARSVLKTVQDLTYLCKKTRKSYFRRTPSDSEQYCRACDITSLHQLHATQALPLWNGDHKLEMIIKKDISFVIQIGKYPIVISYKGKTLCCHFCKRWVHLRCSSLDHTVKTCSLQRR